MSEPITIIVYGKPHGKGRARVTKKGFAYTPKKTKENQAYIQSLATEAMIGKNKLQGAVEMELYIYAPIPAKFRKAERQLALDGKLRPIERPDLDNVIKQVSDSCNWIVYTDDCQISEIKAFRYYSLNPRLHVTFREAQP